MLLCFFFRSHFDLSKWCVCVLPLLFGEKWQIWLPNSALTFKGLHSVITDQFNNKKSIALYLTHIYRVCWLSVFFLLPDYLVFSSNAIAIGHRIWHDSFRMKKTYFKNRLRQIWLWSWFGFWIKIYLTNILRFCVIPVERTVFSSFEKTVTTARWQMIY